MATPNPAPASRNRRAWVIGASAVLIVVVAVLLFEVLRDHGPADDPGAAAHTSAPATHVTAPVTTPTLPARSVALGEIVVQAGPDGIELYEAAGDTSPSDELGPWTALGAPTTLLGFDTATVDGVNWIQVELPGAPNHRQAWVREPDVAVTSTPARIDIYLEERELDLSVGGDVQLSHSVVIGAPGSPTPLGVFWVTDPLDFTTNPSGVYGAYALGLNGWSETLETFNGGPPQLAIHGTNKPELLGENVSNGCIRLPNDVMTEVAAAAPVGTPVVVHAARTS